MRKVSTEIQQNLFRFVVVLCLCWTLFPRVFSSAMEAVSVFGQLQELGAAQTGMGGGSYIDPINNEENTIDMAEFEERHELEPESVSRPRPLLFGSYSIKEKDLIGSLAASFGLHEDTLISVNDIKNTRQIQIGQVLRVPNQDGILYKVKQGDTLEKIAEKYRQDPASIKLANELLSDKIQTNATLFIPGARLELAERQERSGIIIRPPAPPRTPARARTPAPASASAPAPANGTRFQWPVSGRITSSYGNRRSPFSGAIQFHNGLDIAAPMGTPVRAAMAGRVTLVTYDDIMGNQIYITHGDNFRTMYAHLSDTFVAPGDNVAAGDSIGAVGTTGISTGPHLHFTVYRDGATVNPRSYLR